MRVQIAPSPASAGRGHALTTFLIDGTLVVDAGALGSAYGPADLGRIRDILLTHSHADHVAGLPMYLDTAYGLGPPPVVHALPDTLHSLRTDVFNDRLFPDFVKLSTFMPPFLILSEVVPDAPFRAGKYHITPLSIDHAVPAVAYLIDDGKAVLAVLTDTQPVPEVYKKVAATPRLGAVLLEASFPRREARLAQVSKHLTPPQFAEAVKALPADVPVYAIHIKPRFYEDVVRELAEFRFRNVTIADPGMEFDVKAVHRK